MTTRTGKVKKLEVQIVSAQKKADDVESERDEAKAGLRQLQSGQPWYQSAMSREQTDTAALGTELDKDRKCLVCRLEQSSDQVLKDVLE